MILYSYILAVWLALNISQYSKIRNGDFLFMKSFSCPENRDMSSVLWETYIYALGIHDCDTF